MADNKLKIDHLVAIERELLWHDNKWSHLLIIYTDLEMNPYQQGYDSLKINAMVHEVAQYHKEQGLGFSSISVRSYNGVSAQLLRSQMVAE